MDRINIVRLGDVDDYVDREVGFERSLSFADLVCLVGLEAMQGQLVMFRTRRF